MVVTANSYFLDPGKLRAASYRAGLTQGQIAEKVGCSRPYINIIWNGKRVKAELAEAIADALGTTIEEIEL